MADYLVRIETYTQHKTKRKGYKLRPLKQVLDDKLIDLDEAEFQFEEYVLWDTIAVKSTLLEDKTYVICHGFHEYLEEQQEKTVMPAKAFVDIAKSIHDPSSPFVPVLVLDENFVDMYMHSSVKVHNYDGLLPIYVSTGSQVYGSFIVTSSGFLTTRYNFEKINVYDLALNQSDIYHVNFFTNDENFYFNLISRKLLQAVEPENVTLVTDNDLMSLFTSAIEAHYSKSKTRDEISVLKAVAKSMQQTGMLAEYTDRLTQMFDNTNTVLDIGKKIIIDGFPKLSNNIKEQLFTELFNNQNTAALLYNYAKSRKDYKGKIDKLIGEYAGDEKAKTLAAENKRLSQELQAAKQTTQLAVVSPTVKEDPELAKEIRQAQRLSLEREKSYYELLPRIFTQDKKGVFKDMFELIRNKANATIAYEKLKEIFDSYEERNTTLDTQLTDLTQKVESKQAQLKALEAQLQEKQAQMTDVTNQYVELLPAYYEKLAFEPVLAERMMQAAKRVSGEADTPVEVNTVPMAEKYKMPVKDYVEYAPKELVSRVQNSLRKQKHRDLGYNDVANVLLCVSQGFLTILAGEPGTGKTSLVTSLAEILGYTNNACSRFTEVAVEKGWTSRRDLIGYYNPLTKSFDAANGGLYSALSMLDQESRAQVADFPYWVLLDEANLSQMEHYWADFMALCDLTKNQRQVSCGGEHVFDIPKTMRFLATVNLDYTTERMSPRLVDRAWIIRLQAPDFDYEFDVDEIIENQPAVTFSVFEKLLSAEACNPSLIAQVVKARLREIYDLFAEKIKVYLSPRVMKMVIAYCAAATRLMEFRGNDFVALDYAVAQKILPTINGFGEEYCAFIEALMQLCPIQEMPISYGILKEIKNRGMANMQYYQYFLVRN